MDCFSGFIKYIHFISTDLWCYLCNYFSEQYCKKSFITTCHWILYTLKFLQQTYFQSKSIFMEDFLTCVPFFLFANKKDNIFWQNVTMVIFMLRQIHLMWLWVNKIFPETMNCGLEAQKLMRYLSQNTLVLSVPAAKHQNCGKL